MKRTVYRLLFLLLVLGGSCGFGAWSAWGVSGGRSGTQAGTRDVVQPSAQQGAQSTMRFAQSQWDFGRVEELGGDVEHTFEFTNTGTEPFVIENIIVSCGCTTPEYTRSPIRPGGKGQVTIIFDPVGQPGVFSKDIHILSRNQQNRNKITIKGEVIPRPRTVQDEFPIPVGGGLRVDQIATGMGYIPRGATKSVVINYYNEGNSTIRLAAVADKPNNYFKISFSEPILKPKGRGVITLTYDLRSASLWGRVEDNFDITVGGRKANMKFSSTGIAADDFTKLTGQQLASAPRGIFVTQYHNFGTVKPGTPNSNQFVVANEGEEPLIVRYVSCSEGVTAGIKPGTTIRSGEELTFSVTLNIPTGTKPGKKNGEVSIIFNDPERPLREIRVAVTVQ